MKRTDKPDGGYILTADAGKDLVVMDGDGNVIARTKEVAIPAAGTLNTWVETAEELPVAPEVSSEDADKAIRIAELEAELARLKGDTV